MCKKLIPIHLLFFMGVILHAETIGATFISNSSATIYVGQTITAQYSFPLSIHREDLNITFHSSDDIIIKKVVIDRAATAGKLPSNNRLLILEYIAKHTGVLSIPHIQIGNDIVRFPLINVMSTLRTEDTSQMPISTYVPWVEFLEFLILFVILLLGIYMAVALIGLFFQHSRRTSYLLANLFNLWECVRQVNAILLNLKRVGLKRSRRYLLNIDCYTRMLEIVQKRLVFFYSKNNILSLTIEEIHAIISKNTSMLSLNKEDTNMVFEAMNQVLYGNKIYSISLRTKHFKHIKKILLNSLKYDEYSDVDKPKIPSTLTVEVISMDKSIEEGFNVF